jgi:hypothetical protein
VAQLVEGLGSDDAAPGGVGLFERLCEEEDKRFATHGSGEWGNCINPRCGRAPVLLPPRVDPDDFVAEKLAVSFRRVACRRPQCFEPHCADCHCWGGHDPLSCEEWRDWEDQAAYDADAGAAAAEKASIEAIKSFSKQCPSCKTFIYKDSGCNHMGEFYAQLDLIH